MRRLSTLTVPGLAFANVPNGVAVIDAIPALGWDQINFFNGAVPYGGELGDFDASKPVLPPTTEDEKPALCEDHHGRFPTLATMELLLRLVSAKKLTALTNQAKQADQAKSSGQWQAPSAEGEQIIALTARVKVLQTSPRGATGIPD